jgi:hypothetical protein
VGLGSDESSRAKANAASVEAMIATARAGMVDRSSDRQDEAACEMVIGRPFVCEDAVTI